MLSILLGISLVFALAPFIETGLPIYSFSYAFTSALLGLVLASLKWCVLRFFRKPTDFEKDWQWIWAILLAVLVATYLLPKLI